MRATLALNGLSNSNHQLLSFSEAYPAHPQTSKTKTYWPICPEQEFFGTNYYYYFHLPIGPFHCAKFKKLLTADSSRVMRMCHFWAQNGSFAQAIFFFLIIKIILIYPFIVQNF